MNWLDIIILLVVLSLLLKFADILLSMVFVGFFMVLSLLVGALGLLVGLFQKYWELLFKKKKNVGPIASNNFEYLLKRDEETYHTIDLPAELIITLFNLLSSSQSKDNTNNSLIDKITDILLSACINQGLNTEEYWLNKNRKNIPITMSIIDWITAYSLIRLVKLDDVEERKVLENLKGYIQVRLPKVIGPEFA